MVDAGNRLVLCGKREDFPAPGIGMVAFSRCDTVYIFSAKVIPVYAGYSFRHRAPDDEHRRVRK